MLDKKKKIQIYLDYKIGEYDDQYIWVDKKRQTNMKTNI